MNYNIISEDSMKFNNAKLKGLMAEHDYTVYDLADKIGISHATLSYIRCGKINPTLNTLTKLMDIFQIKDLNFFFLT